MINNIKNDLSYTGVGDRPSNRRTILTITLPKIIDEIQNKTFDEFYLESQGIQKFIIPSNIIDIYTRLEISQGLKLSGHSNTLTEALSLIEWLYRMGELQNERQYRNALHNFQI